MSAPYERQKLDPSNPTLYIRFSEIVHIGEGLVDESVTSRHEMFGKASIGKSYVTF